jgi:hypothetical protein
MSEQVQVIRSIFGKSTYQNVIDTKFSQLIPQDTTNVTPDVGVVKFFQYYNELFFDIPPSGSYSGSLGMSHADLVDRSSNYLGISITNLITEINELRNENVSLKNQIFVLTNQTGSVV